MIKLTVGPILGLESDCLYTVCFSTPDTVDHARFNIDDQHIVCERIGTTPSSIIWKASYSATASAQSQRLTYSISLDGKPCCCQNNRLEWHVFIPAESEIPKFAYTSCNGFSSLDLMHKTQQPYQLWKNMQVQHQQQPLSLILMGGDQLYADEIWGSVAELKKWSELPHSQKVSRKASKTLCEQVDRFFDKLYQQRWLDESMSLMMATVPSVMMWDDHDIFDGWGSYPDELQQCDVFQQIFTTAKHYFELFQIRSRNNQSLLEPTANHYAFALNFRGYHILALDNRAERSLNQVMSKHQWQLVNDYLSNMDAGHLLVLSAVPVVYRDFSLPESIVDNTPWDEELTDDLKDHWRAKEHQGERARLIHRLLSNANRRQQHDAHCKTVILSGDIHIGSLGVISDKSQHCKIHQIVSSGIVHPAPSRIQWLGIMALTNDNDEYLDEDRHIQISMLKPFASDRYIRHRNYITLLMGNDKKLWVNWNTEGSDDPYYPIT